MANEYCLTNDAKPDDFRFFRYQTIWTKEQYQREQHTNMWFHVEGPASVRLQSLLHLRHCLSTLLYRTSCS